ncbi:hypothetical protein Q1695_000170 [Nippostrongylus brasiliensis]|nr:hypothetical protein Q1695_000170 [Nippostrongylus brasiliensis]
MRLKRIDLVLVALCTHMAYANQGRSDFMDTNANVATMGPLSCAHDGYNSGNSCVCKPYFSKSSCTQRVCQNDGVLRNYASDYGCRCPPGFLGTSCEPVKCVGGETHSFYEDSKSKSVYVMITYNSFMSSTMVQDDPFVAVCQAVQKADLTNAYWSIDFPMTSAILTDSTGDIDSCVARAKEICDPPSSCDPNSLSLANLDALIDQSQGNSQILVITNSALDTVQNVNNTIRKAISRRIQVHVIALAPTNIIADSDFNMRPDYVALRSIADATLGFFVTPYSGFTRGLLGVTTVSQVISNIFDLIVNNVETVSVKPIASAPNMRYNVGQEKFYLSFRSLGNAPESITISPKNSLVLMQDTGFWKMYSGQESSGFTEFSVSYSGSNPDFNVQLLSRSALNTFVAVTSSDSMDASSPFATVGSTNTVVGRVYDTTTAITDSIAVNMSNNIPFSAQVSSRGSCQFFVALGTVTCDNETNGFISVMSSNGKGSSVPFFCSDKAMAQTAATSSITAISSKVDVSNDIPKCSSQLRRSSALESIPFRRTFAIVARNVRDENSDSSTVDNIFVYPNNILDYMTSYMIKYPDYYSTFLTNIFSSTNPKSTFQTPSISTFMTSLMNTIHNATENDADEMFDYSTALKEAMYVQESYSDIVLIVDSAADQLFDDNTILQTLSIKRIKIYIVFVEIYSSVSEDFYRKCAEFVTATGGAAFRFGDYATVRKYFGVYFNNVVGRDEVTYRSFNTDEMNSLSLVTYPFMLHDNATYSAVLIVPGGSSNVQSASLQSSNGNSENCDLQPIGGDLTLISLQSPIGSSSGSSQQRFQLKIQLRSGSENSSPSWGKIFVYEELPSLSVSVALSATTIDDGNSETLCILPSMIYFFYFFSYFNKPQYIALNVMGSDATQHNVTVVDSNGMMLLNSAPTTSREGCLYPFVVNTELLCGGKNTAYQIQVDSSGGFTRTQLLPCFDDGATPCAHGTYNSDTSECVCEVRWGGASCETRICENGGTTLADNTCSCESGKYSGDFCEISSLNCTSSPQLPYLANEVSTLILVVERYYTPLQLSLTPAVLKALLGVNTIVVYYGGGLSPSVVFSSTNSQLLPDVLQQIQQFNTSAPAESPYDAIELALKSQVTDRSVVAVLSRGGNFPITETLLNQLSLRRAELRIFSQKDVASYTTLALLGNGIPFIFGNQKEFEQDYFPNYVVPIVSKATSLSSPILNVIASGLDCNVALTIPPETFSMSLPLFVHTKFSSGSSVAVTVQQGGKDIPVSGSVGSVTKKYSVLSNQPTEISISSSDRCSFSVEMLNFYKIGYAFQLDNVNEKGFSGLSQGENYMSFYAANTLVGDLQRMPYFQLQPVATDGTLGDVSLVPTTAKSAQCIYTYYAAINCTKDIFGYQAQVVSFSTGKLKRLQQLALVCSQTDRCNGHGTIVSGLCQCNSNWDGDDCSLPVCMNGGTRQGNVCKCSSSYTGTFCENPIIRGMAFILDSVGLDDTAYNSSIMSINQFVSLYDMENLMIMLIDNALGFKLNNVFQKYTSSLFTNTINGLYPSRNRNGNLSLDNVFSKIYQNAAVLQNSTTYNYVFYVTQTGGQLKAPSILQVLQDDYGFTIACIGVSAYNRSLPQTTLNDLSVIGFTQTADSWYTGMMAMVNVSPGIEKPLPTRPPPPACANTQMSLFIAADLSVGVDKYRDKMLSIVNLLPTAFDLGFDAVNNDGCDVVDLYKGSSRISGWTYYDSYLGVNLPTFCVSNLLYVMKSIQNDDADGPNPQFSGARGLLATFSHILSNQCMCSRYSDSDTKKAVIWMPIANYTSDDYNQLLATPYTHLVVPFYDLYDGDFYKGLSKNNGTFNGELPNASNMSAEEIVNNLWSTMCGEFFDSICQPVVK